MKVFRWGLIAALTALFLAATTACFDGDDAGDDTHDGADVDDDDAHGDDDDDDGGDDDDSFDDDGDDDGDDDLGPDTTPSLNFGLVHYHYYFDLGGYDGAVFDADSEWLAVNVELAIMGYGDLGMDLAWERLRSLSPRGHWLKWRLGQLIATNETAGSCDDPEVGLEHAFFDEHMAEFQDFLADRPEYGDGESCFLHARHDGWITARWHAAGCDVELFQRGLNDSAVDLEDARVFTLVFDDYAWLIDMASDCGRDFIAHRSVADALVEGYGGVGFDNIGGRLGGDGYYLPVDFSGIDIIEIDDATEADPGLLEQWWSATLAGFLEAVRSQLRAAAPDSLVVFNAGSYCTWDASVPGLVAVGAPGLGVWCEGAIQHPSWGALYSVDRLRAFADLSERMAERGGIVALETFYAGGSENPGEEELLFYLAVNDVLGDAGNYFIVKPDWDPYVPLEQAAWFGILGIDFGAPQNEVREVGDGIFDRDFLSASGMQTRIVARGGQAGDSPVGYDLPGAWCRVGADGSFTAVDGNPTLAVGDGLFLVRAGAGGVDCG